MYSYRVTSFVIFTSLFWTLEMLFSLLVWWLGSAYLPSSPDSEELDETIIKEERDNTQAVKKEEEDDRVTRLHDYPPPLEADDEDDEVPLHSLIGSGALRISDSGLGTSLESSASRQDLLRRRSKPAMGGGG
jgi:seipin